MTIFTYKGFLVGDSDGRLIEDYLKTPAYAGVLSEASYGLNEKGEPSIKCGGVSIDEVVDMYKYSAEIRGDLYTIIDGKNDPTIDKGLSSLNLKRYIKQTTDQATIKIHGGLGRSEQFNELYKRQRDSLSNINKKMQDEFDTMQFYIPSDSELMATDETYEEDGIPPYEVPFFPKYFGLENGWDDRLYRVSEEFKGSHSQNEEIEIFENELEYYNKLCDTMDETTAIKDFDSYIDAMIYFALIYSRHYTGKISRESRGDARIEAFNGQDEYIKMFTKSGDDADEDDSVAVSAIEGVTSKVNLSQIRDANGNAISIYVTLGMGNIKEYINKAIRLGNKYAKIECLIKVLRFGKRKPKKIQLKGMETFFDLTEFSETSAGVDPSKCTLANYPDGCNCAVQGVIYMSDADDAKYIESFPELSATGKAIAGYIVTQVFTYKDKPVITNEMWFDALTLHNQTEFKPYINRNIIKSVDFELAMDRFSSKGDIYNKRIIMPNMEVVKVGNAKGETIFPNLTKYWLKMAKEPYIEEAISDIKRLGVMEYRIQNGSMLEDVMMMDYLFSTESWQIPFKLNNLIKKVGDEFTVSIETKTDRFSTAVKRNTLSEPIIIKGEFGKDNFVLNHEGSCKFTIYKIEDVVIPDVAIEVISQHDATVSILASGFAIANGQQNRIPPIKIISDGKPKYPGNPIYKSGNGALGEFLEEYYKR